MRIKLIYVQVEKKYFLIIGLLVLISCDNDESIEPDTNRNKGTQLTEIALMGANGKAWSGFEGSLEYFSSTGNSDSIVNLKFDLSQEPPITWFGNNRGSGGMNFVYYTSPPFSDLLPEFGTWTLDQKNQTISFFCNGIGVDCLAKKNLNGTWIIDSYSDGGIELLTLEKNEDLPNQRKLKKKISLGKIGY